MSAARSPYALALALLCAIAVWPYWPLLSLGPVALDSAEWIAHGASSDPNWQEWVFGTRHFGVGYRPITALSFTLNHAIGGFAPAGFRVVDLALHLLSGLLVYRLYCALADRQANRQLGGAIAAAVMLLHPAAQDVLPILARRSYLLASVFGLAALTVFARSLLFRAAPVGAGIASGLLLAAALFSNESSAMAIAVVPLVAAVVLGRLDWREIASTSSIPVSFGIFAVVLRLTLVGGTGGYALGESLSSRVVPVLAAAWRSLGGLSFGDHATLPVAVLLLLLGLAVWQLLQALRKQGVLEAGILLLGALWLVGATLLYASQGVWYPRQSYLLLAPLALVVGQLVARASGWTARAPWIAFAVVLLSDSPVVHGLDSALLSRLTTRDAGIVALDRALENVEPPARVRLVIPFVRGEGAANPLRADTPAELHRDYFTASIWLNALRHGEGIRVEDFLFYEVGPDAATAPVLERGANRLRGKTASGRSLRLGSRAYRFGPPTLRRDLRANSRVELERSAPDGIREYLLILDGEIALLHEL